AGELQRRRGARGALDRGAARDGAGRVHRRHPVSRDAELREEDPRDRRGLPPPVRQRPSRAGKPEERAAGPHVADAGEAGCEEEARTEARRQTAGALTGWWLMVGG